MRRLITLISAGRNRTIVIRRELPRTKNADWAVKPYHIKRWRILLSVCPRPVTGSVAISKFKAKATNQPANEAPSGAEWPAITIGRPTPVRAEEVRHPGCPFPWPISRYAARAVHGGNFRSVFTAMAQINPNNSRPTAATICGFFLLAAASFL